MVAETAGLVGAWLRRSPGIVLFSMYLNVQGIRDWLGTTPQPVRRHDGAGGRRRLGRSAQPSREVDWRENPRAASDMPHCCKFEQCNMLVLPMQVVENMMCTGGCGSSNLASGLRFMSATCA